jgi:hypothetical protein
LESKSIVFIIAILLGFSTLYAQPWLPGVVPTQLDYRWRNDDGSETSATWKAATSSSATVTNCSNVRLRFSLHEMDSRTNGWTNYTLTLQYSLNQSSWTTITNSSDNHFQLSLSDNFNDGDICTEQITDATIGGGRMTESATQFNFGFEDTEENEFEYCFKATAQAVNGTYYFRMGGGIDYFQNAIMTLDFPDVSFTGGSDYTPFEFSKSGDDEAIGRFKLTSSSAGPLLEGTSIRLNGSRSGISNLKLWAFDGESFDQPSATQLGTTVENDPGDGNSATWSGFSQPIGTSTFYLTANIAPNATGSIQGVIADNASLSLLGSNQVTTISNAPLSNMDNSLPVELFLFSAKLNNGHILVNWTTESEMDNLGYILERCNRTIHESSLRWQSIASYKSFNSLKGQGNTSSSTDYEYLDLTAQPGTTYHYRLSDVDMNGRVTFLETLLIVFESEIPDETLLGLAFPNPFNQQTQIAYQLAEETSVFLSVYDIQGRLVAHLIKGTRQLPGGYNIHWLGKDDFGRNAASGTYLLRLIAGDVVQLQKVLLMR